MWTYLVQHSNNAMWNREFTSRRAAEKFITAKKRVSVFSGSFVISRQLTNPQETNTLPEVSRG